MGANLFAYCGNDPINRLDPSGAISWGEIAAIIIVLLFTTVAGNHIINIINEYKIKNEIKESYTWEEAENVIKAIITPYVEDPRVTHNSNEVCIFESNKVHKRYDRQKACMIIARTVDEEGKAVTSREYDNMSAEWFAHNLAGKILPLPSITKHTDDVNLELNKDSRGIVRFASKVMEILGAE